MIVDILRPEAGQILWHGTPAHEIERRVVGYMPEERGLYAEMSVGEHVRFFARVRGLPSAEADANTARWLERMALTDQRDAKVQELSKGNQQKVQLFFLPAIGDAIDNASTNRVAVVDRPAGVATALQRALPERVAAINRVAGAIRGHSTHYPARSLARALGRCCH
jgi:ABC-type Na+ transport system ATPase subunit NatA